MALMDREQREDREDLRSSSVHGAGRLESKADNSSTGTRPDLRSLRKYGNYDLWNPWATPGAFYTHAAAGDFSPHNSCRSDHAGQPAPRPSIPIETMSARLIWQYAASAFGVTGSGINDRHLSNSFNATGQSGDRRARRSAAASASLISPEGRPVESQIAIRRRCAGADRPPHRARS